MVKDISWLFYHVCLMSSNRVLSSGVILSFLFSEASTLISIVAIIYLQKSIYFLAWNSQLKPTVYEIKVI